MLVTHINLRALPQYWYFNYYKIITSTGLQTLFKSLLPQVISGRYSNGASVAPTSQYPEPEALSLLLTENRGHSCSVIQWRNVPTKLSEYRSSGSTVGTHNMAIKTTLFHFRMQSRNRDHSITFSS